MGRTTKINSLTSPELIEKVNPENIRLKEDFLGYLKSIGRSEKTLLGYDNDLNILYCFMLNKCENKSFINLTKRDLVSFQGWLLNENENSPSRIRRIKSTISSLSNFIMNILDDQYENYRSIIKKIESPMNQPVREKTVLSDEQLDYLLSILAERGKYQIACAVALAAYSGVRKSELVRFKVSYFYEGNIIYGSLYRTPEKILTKGMSGGKYLTKYIIANKFQPYLDLWLKQREELGINNDYLFVKNYGTNSWEIASTSTLNSWALTNSKILGIDFYWHCLRHMFATAMVKQNLPDSVIVDIIGWTTQDMLKIYDDSPVEDKFAKYFDENGIKEIKPTELADL